MSDFDSDWDTKKYNLFCKNHLKIRMKCIGIPCGSHQMGRDCPEALPNDRLGDRDKILSRYKSQIRLHLNQKLLEGLLMLQQIIVRFDKIELALKWGGLK